MLAAFKNNWKLYLMEALGLAIFMVSACFFSAMLFSPHSSWYSFFSNEMVKNIVMGLAMGTTALFIFYSPVTAPGGAHINPAVTVTFLWLGKIKKEDALFYILFQFIGGTLAVFVMQRLMGPILTAAPVNSAVTVPGKGGTATAAFTEFVIAFIMISMVLFSSASKQYRKYTRKIAACLVCCYVTVAGPVSGFGMNPARSFASAFPAHTYTAFWIYMIMPFAGMLSAAACFTSILSAKKKCRMRIVHRNLNLKKSQHEEIFKDFTY